MYDTHESRQIFKNSPENYNLNCVISLTDSIYVYPNLHMKINKNQIEQSIIEHSMTPYFLKTEFGEDAII